MKDKSRLNIVIAKYNAIWTIKIMKIYKIDGQHS